MYEHAMTMTSFNPEYPFEAFKVAPIIGAFTELMHQTNQSPLPMCAMSVLAACTLPVQGLIKVKWRNAPPSPVGMIFVVEAESGERKSSNDQMALKEQRLFDKEQSRLEADDEAKHEIEMLLWVTARKRLLRTIKRKAEKNELTSAEEKELKEHETRRPARPKRPRMLISNITAPAIPRHLAEKYPFAGLFGDEGGVILSSGALSDPAMINTVWDSGDFISDRIVRGRVEVHDASLTVHIQVQPGVLSHFLAGHGKLTHQSGNSSRWLYANPPSTQGQRHRRFIDLPTGAGQVFDQRVRDLLQQYTAGEPPLRNVKCFSSAAEDLLAWFSDAIELELPDGRWFALMRGAASKATEVCARLSAVIHEFEGLDGEIGVDVARGAIMIVAWHLNQYRQRFAARTQDEIDSLDLEDCITRHVHRWKNAYVPGPVLCRFAPRRMRQRDKLRKVLATLQAEGKVKVFDSVGHPEWYVQLKYWAPSPPPPPASYNTMTSTFGAGRQYGPVPEPPPAPQPRPDGHELWPGVFLPPTTP